MKLNTIDVRKTLDDTKKLLEQESNLSPEIHKAFELLSMIIEGMMCSLSLNSKNSSKPPSSDPNGKKPKGKKSNKSRKPGGQPGRKGVQLKPVDKPDKIEVLKVDKRKIPQGDYQEAGYEARQVVDFKVSAYVKEYRAQILIDRKGNRYVAQFPKHVARPIQYGPKTKGTSVYLSQYQLTPYKRIEEYFSNQVRLQVSVGSFFNFNKEAYERLSEFDQIAKAKLISCRVLNSDETGINVNGKRLWLHTACNSRWIYFYPHEKQ